jgi:hypothetical protein
MAEIKMPEMKPMTLLDWFSPEQRKKQIEAHAIMQAQCNGMQMERVAMPEMKGK